MAHLKIKVFFTSQKHYLVTRMTLPFLCSNSIYSQRKF